MFVCSAIVPAEVLASAWMRRLGMPVSGDTILRQLKRDALLA